VVPLIKGADIDLYQVSRLEFSLTRYPVNYLLIDRNAGASWKMVYVWKSRVSTLPADGTLRHPIDILRRHSRLY